MPTEVNAVVRWVEGLNFKGFNPQGQGALLGSTSPRFPDIPAQGASPMELVLQAAGGCTGMDVIAILHKRQLQPTFFEVLVKGFKRDLHPKIYERIEVVYRAAGEGITEEELERAASLSQSTYCPVFAMLRAVAEVTWRCEVVSGTPSEP